MPPKYSLIQSLLQDEIDTRFPIFFDVSSLMQFKLWAQNNQPLYTELTERAKADKLKIVVFDSQLKKDPLKYKNNRNSLEIMYFQIDEEYAWATEYDLYATELQSIYFHDERTDLARKHAEFLVLGRYASADHELRIITDHPAFSRILNANVYLLSKPGRLELPPNINIFLDLEMHETLLKATSGFFYNGEYSTSVFEAAKELFDLLRQKSTKTSDGRTLINQTVKIDTVFDQTTGELRINSRNNVPAPTFKLNSLTSSDEIGEHSAYFNFLLGLTDLIRNPYAHNPASDAFMKRLFSDQKTVIKMLGFLSLLFEKVEKGTL